MKPVTIIANPASGKDIRRLVAHGSVVHAGEKVNVIRRVLLGLDSVGVKHVLVMPDRNNLCLRAADGLDLSLEVSPLKMIPEHSQEDSTQAAEISKQIEAGCTIVLGGDGTNRVAAKSIGNIPLLPIATGTNNVFSNMVEGTLAGIAAGIIALSDSLAEELTCREPRLEIWKDNTLADIALIDLVVSSEHFVGSRAIWEISSLKEVFLTRAEPENIGFSALGGFLCHLPHGSGQGLHIKIGPGDKTVMAPIAPGLVKQVPIKSVRVFEPGEKILINHSPAVIALDGEREFTLKKDEVMSVKLNLNGPRVVNISKTLQWASKECLFTNRKEVKDV